MGEGRVYVCQWKQDERGLHVWVRGRPRVKGTYAGWDELHDQFWEVIMAATGDGEPVLTFDPPLPGSEDEQELLRAGLAIISGAAYSGSKTSPVDLFTDGICLHCGWARGRRNDKPAHFYSLEGPVCQMPQEWWFTVSGLYVSEGFLASLTDAERACFDTLPIERPPRSRLKFFEIVPRTFIQYVAHAQREITGGWRCPKCRRQVIAQDAEHAGVNSFVAAADLPVPLPPVLAIGDPADYDLCMPLARARELMRDPGARGLDVELLGVLPARLVDRAPALKLAKRGHSRWLPREIERRDNL